jgi:hypothetical protein
MEIYRNDDAGARKRTRVTVDPMSGLPLIITEQDVRPILEANKRQANDWDRNLARRTPGGWRKIAELPAVVVMQLNQMGIMRGTAVLDERRLLRILSDPENRYLRTDNGARLA